MAQQKSGGLRRFLTTRVGKALLVALTILVVFACLAYAGSDGELIAIPAFLIFGLGIPIWAGLKRPRFLALSGLVVLLITAPLATAVLTQELYAPEPPAVSCSSSSSASYCSGYVGTNAILQNASVAPYSGSTSTNFTWSLTVFPRYVPPGNSTVWNLSLYISSCPGATSTSPPSWCSAGYPFTQITQTLNLSNTSGPVSVVFHDVIGENGIWDWQMGLYTLNGSTHKPFYQNLVGDPLYNGIEGPVIGDFSTTYSSIVGGFYFEVFLFLGGPFYLVLLVYLLFKNRERRRQDSQRRAAGPVPPTGSPPGTAAGGSGAPALPASGPPSPGAPPVAAPASERACPNCNAVVYPNETKCWKCGADLTSGSSAAPLPTGKAS